MGPDPLMASWLIAADQNYPRRSAEANHSVKKRRSREGGLGVAQIGGGREREGLAAWLPGGEAVGGSSGVQSEAARSATRQ